MQDSARTRAAQSAQWLDERHANGSFAVGDDRESYSMIRMASSSSCSSSSSSSNASSSRSGYSVPSRASFESGHDADEYGELLSKDDTAQGRSVRSCFERNCSSEQVHDEKPARSGTLFLPVWTNAPSRPTTSGYSTSWHSLSPRKASCVTLGATAAITLALSVYFGIFSTLFVYLAWVCVGLPLDMVLEASRRRIISNGDSHELSTAGKKSSHLSSSTWLASRIGRALGLYAWLCVAAITIRHCVDPLGIHDSVTESTSNFAANDYLLLTPFSNGSHFRATSHNDAAPVFIASNLYNSAHLFPRFSKNLLELIDLLGGPTKAYVSIYESNSNDGNATVNALHELGQSLEKRRVNSRILTDSQRAKHIGVDGEAHARIEMLANVRNMAMKPLDEGISGVGGKPFRYVLWLNDIVFDPKEMVELLHTNNGTFDAACAFDYVPLGLYDTWVTRDTDGNRPKPLWPYFASPRDVERLDRDKPILVNSCWNGAIAFDARWFTDARAPARGIVGEMADKTLPSDPSSGAPQLPLRFRSSHRCLSSECLLTSLDMHRALHPFRPWIFMNPKAVVAYDQPTFHLYHDLMRWTLTRPWHLVWERFISSYLFAWLSDKGRKPSACRGVFQEDWAPSNVTLQLARWGKT